VAVTRLLNLPFWGEDYLNLEPSNRGALQTPMFPVQYSMSLYRLPHFNPGGGYIIGAKCVAKLGCGRPLWRIYPQSSRGLFLGGSETQLLVALSLTISAG